MNLYFVVSTSQRELSKGVNLMVPLWVVLIAILVGCASVPDDHRIDNFPMYGQPAIQRPNFLKKADEDFITEASSGLGSREAASKAWAAKADEYMNKRDYHYAMRRYNQSWLLNPNNYQPHWGFGRIMLERGKLGESLSRFEKAKELLDDQYQKVALLADTGSAYSVKANQLPKDKAQERADSFRLANENFQQSISLDPSYTKCYFVWARSLYWEERYADAWE